MTSAFSEEARCHAISTLRNLAAGATDAEDYSVHNKVMIIESGALE